MYNSLELLFGYLPSGRYSNMHIDFLPVCIFEYYKTREGVIVIKTANKKIKASTTMEAIIVMPTILIMLFAVFFAFQILYQHVVLEYAASYGASEGAMLWDYETNGIDLENGTVGEKVGPYANLNQLFTGSGISDRKNFIKEQTESVIKSLSIFSGDITVSVEYDGKFTGRYITVTAKQNISIPFEAIMKYFNDGDMSLTAKSTATVYDPDEFIRNADYVYEISSSIIKQVSEKIKEIKKNMKN